MPRVLFGNESVIEEVKKDPGVDAAADNVSYLQRRDLGRQVTTFYIQPVAKDDPTGWTLAKQLAFVESVWPRHSDKDPSWVESDEPLLEQLLSAQYGCPGGRPKNWKVG